MSDKRHQLSILDQWATQSGQVSRSTERLAEIAEWIDWDPLYEIGRCIDKTGPQDGSEIQIEVRDMGRGISEESREKIFSKFKQADDSIENSYGGSGLGLTISRYIVEKMGGEIALESELGEGTSFYVNLSLPR